MGLNVPRSFIFRSFPMWSRSSFIAKVRAVRERGRRWRNRFPAVFTAWWISLQVWFWWRVRGDPVLKITHRLSAERTRLRRGMTPADVVAVVHRAVPGTRGEGCCLFRALVRFGLFHRTGTDAAVLCLGVQPPDAAERFAHAWVEVHGTPIGEPSDPRATHRILARWDGSQTGSGASSSAVTTE
jgi:hypothetical protein